MKLKLEVIKVKPLVKARIFTFPNNKPKQGNMKCQRAESLFWREIL